MHEPFKADMGNMETHRPADRRRHRPGSTDVVLLHYPAAGSLGAALYAYHVLLGQPRRFVLEHAYWGAGYAADEVQAALDRWGADYEWIEDEARITDRVVDALAQGRVVGWFQGRFEVRWTCWSWTVS